jgi:broad specificity phosphatase PhoE
MGTNRNIIFVRHGESESNLHIHTDPNDPQLNEKINKNGNPHLTELGKLQAEKTAEYLVDKLKGRHVYLFTSKFARTIETAKPFLERANVLCVTSTELLNEYTKPTKVLSERDRDIGISHHQTWDCFIANVKEFIKVLSECRYGDIVVFGHSLFISVLISYLGSKGNHEINGAEEKTVFELPNCSITTVGLTESDWHIYHVGSINHLNSKLVTGIHVPFAHS